jgi:lipopolysaccharide/colanic/teichoic acid biosynthesis glycosyltransferase
MAKRRILLRTYEILLCLLILGVLFIPLTIIVIFKILQDGLPLFYNSTRIGKDRNAFTVYKFRSMVNDRRAIDNYLNSIQSYGFEKIPLNAVVYTRMGRFFEKFQIVEVLQVFNVLEGNMSLIGYRPLPINRVRQLEEELGMEPVRMRHAVKPGITGISQIVGKTSLSNSDRVVLENKYNLLVQTQPELKVIFYNTLIILETISQIFLKKNFFINYLNNEVNRCHLQYKQDKDEYSRPYSTKKPLPATFARKSRRRVAS